MTGYDLASLRRKQDHTLEQMADKVGISVSQMSKIENGQWPKKAAVVLEVCKAYGLDSETVMSEFLIHGQPENVRKVLSNMLSTAGPSALRGRELQLFCRARGLASTKPMRDAVYRIMDALDSLRSGSSTQPKKDVVRADGEWLRIASDSEIQKKLVFCTKWPAPILMELHRFPPRRAGFHRVPLIGDDSPVEIYTVVKGDALLLARRRGGGVERAHLKCGDSGAYPGVEDHLWANLSRDRELIVQATMYPYVQSIPRNGQKTVPAHATLPDGRQVVRNGSNCEFTLGEKPEALPADFSEILSEMGLI